MDRPLSKVASSLAGAALKSLTKLAHYWRTVPADQESQYRPEQHYMRGPGPKWREAHARTRENRDSLETRNRSTGAGVAG
jgi:hypothetical protein